MVALKKNLWKRFLANFYYKIYSFIGKDVLPPKPKHEPISIKYIESKIVNIVDGFLKSCGFIKSEMDGVWYRDRVSEFRDYFYLEFVYKPRSGMLSVSLSVGFFIPTLECIKKNLSDGGLDSVTSFVKPLDQVVNKNIRRSWFFWNIDFSEEKTREIIWQIEDYALPFYSSINERCKLIELINKKSDGLFSDTKAFLLYLGGEKDGAVGVLEEAIERTSPKAKTGVRYKYLLKIRDLIKNGEIETLIQNLKR